MEKIIIHTDGGARGNPGPAGIGVVIENETGKVIKEISEYIGEATNNVAEYHALIRALGEAKVLLGERTLELPFEVMMDSELVVRQMQGLYKVKEPTLKEKFAMVAQMRMEDFPNITFTHVRREKNGRADKLVNDAIDKAQIDK
ncbi:MAG: ribonuclease HI family protein [Patescibacteria group bacterium]|nr:ribonuclease HI family protein [Patescibacteria group bacterium]